jgi:hypothetical protein
VSVEAVNKFILQSKPRYIVTHTRDNIFVVANFMGLSLLLHAL